MCNMVFVNYVYDMVVDSQFHKFYGGPFARVLHVFFTKDIGEKKLEYNEMNSL